MYQPSPGRWTRFGPTFCQRPILRNGRPELLSHKAVGHLSTSAISCRAGAAQPKPDRWRLAKQLSACSWLHKRRAHATHGTAGSISIHPQSRTCPPDSQSLAAPRAGRRGAQARQAGGPEAARSTRQVCTAAGTGWGRNL